MYRNLTLLQIIVMAHFFFILFVFEPIICTKINKLLKANEYTHSVVSKSLAHYMLISVDFYGYTTKLCYKLCFYFCCLFVFTVKEQKALNSHLFPLSDPKV